MYLIKGQMSVCFNKNAKLNLGEHKIQAYKHVGKYGNNGSDDVYPYHNVAIKINTGKNARLKEKLHSDR